MYRSLLFLFVVVFVALGVFIWASDRITLEGERTIYTVGCEQGVWVGLRCTGRLAACRHRFRASRSRQEIATGLGPENPSGKYSDCDVTTATAGTASARRRTTVDRPGFRGQAGSTVAGFVPLRPQVEMVGAGYRIRGFTGGSPAAATLMRWWRRPRGTGSGDDSRRNAAVRNVCEHLFTNRWATPKRWRDRRVALISEACTGHGDAS